MLIFSVLISCILYSVYMYIYGKTVIVIVIVIVIVNYNIKCMYIDVSD